MAAANYRLCDKCKAKTFYDSDVDYEDSNLGAMTALCKDCAQVYEITIAKRGGVAELRAALERFKAWADRWEGAVYAGGIEAVMGTGPARKELLIAMNRASAALAASEGSES